MAIIGFDIFINPFFLSIYLKSVAGEEDAADGDIILNAMLDSESVADESLSAFS